MLKDLGSLRGTVGFMSVSAGSGVLRVPCAAVVVTGPVWVAVVITSVGVGIVVPTTAGTVVARAVVIALVIGTMTSVRVVFSVASHLERMRESIDSGRCKVGGALVKQDLAIILLSGRVIC